MYSGTCAISGPNDIKFHNLAIAVILFNMPLSTLISKSVHHSPPGAWLLIKPHHIAILCQPTELSGSSNVASSPMLMKFESVPTFRGSRSDTSK